MSNLVCSYCNHKFDNKDRIPRVIPECGHTFCTNCLSCFIISKEKGDFFECPTNK